MCVLVGPKLWSTGSFGAGGWWSALFAVSVTAGGVTSSLELGLSRVAMVKTSCRKRICSRERLSETSTDADFYIMEGWVSSAPSSRSERDAVIRPPVGLVCKSRTVTSLLVLGLVD